METLFCILIAGVLVSFTFYAFRFYNKKIVFELDDRYYNLKDLRKASVEYLRNQGKRCEVEDGNILIVEGEKYYLTERTATFAGVPVQQVVLKQARK